MILLIYANIITLNDQKSQPGKELGSPPEFSLQLALGEMQHGGAAMRAGPGVLAALKLVDEGAHLIEREGLAGAYGAVAGKGDRHFFAPTGGLTAAITLSITSMRSRPTSRRDSA